MFVIFSGALTEQVKKETFLFNSKKMGLIIAMRKGLNTAQRMKFSVKVARVVNLTLVFTD